MFTFRIIMFIFLAKLGICIPIDNSPFLHNYLHRSLAKRALSYIANDTVCIIDNLIYQNGDPIPTDDPCESCKCRPPGFACVLKECDVKPGCKEIPVEGECCPSYQCAGCEHDGKFFEDGEIVPNPNKFLNCYRCRCKGSSIICGLVDCQFRNDCQSRYIVGECCPNYDHCDKPSTEKSIHNNHTLSSTTTYTSIFNIVYASLDQNTTKKIRNSTFESSASSKNTYQPSISDTSNESTIVSPLTVSNPMSYDRNKSFSEMNELTNINNDKKGDMTDEINNELNRVDLFVPNNMMTTNLLNDIESIQTQTSSSKSEILIPNMNSQNKGTQSLFDEVTFSSAIQVDQLNRRIDDSKNDEKNNEKNVEESPSHSTSSMNTINTSTLKPLTTIHVFFDINMPSSMAIPENITDSTILAPNIISVSNFTTLSPIFSNETFENIHIHNLPNNDSRIEKDDFDVDTEEEILIKKLEKKLEETLEDKSEEKSVEERLEAKDIADERVTIDRIDDVNEEIEMPLKHLSKVLNYCKNERCDNMGKLIRVTENMLKEYDSKIIEKVKLSHQFEQLKMILFGNSTIPDIPLTRLINSTDSGHIELDDEMYPTTKVYIKTSDLKAEHKDSENNDLELENDSIRIYQ